MDFDPRDYDPRDEDRFAPRVTVAARIVTTNEMVNRAGHRPTRANARTTRGNSAAVPANHASRIRPSAAAMAPQTMPAGPIVSARIVSWLGRKLMRLRRLLRQRIFDLHPLTLRQWVWITGRQVSRPDFQRRRISVA
jgi:hypothetical protein